MFAFSRPLSLFKRIPASSSNSEFIVDRKLRRNERFLQFLAFGFCFSHERAREALAWLVRCKEDWLRSGQEDIYLGLSEDDQNAFIANLLDTLLKDALRQLDPARPVTMGLSAGFDSRPLHYFLRKNDIKPRTYTFGQVGNLDFDLVKILSKRINLDTEFFDTSEMEWSWEPFERDARHTQDLPISPRVMAQHHMDQQYSNRVDVHGFLNDALTGLFDGLRGYDARDPRNSWEDAIRRLCKRRDRFAWQHVMEIDGAELLPKEPIIDREQIPYFHQLQFGYRHAQGLRLIANSETSSLMFPYEDPRWVGFWLSRPSEDVADRVLHLRYLRSLNAEEFFDLAACRESGRMKFQKRRRSLFYGNGEGGFVTLRKDLMAFPVDPTAHFCLLTCSHNNASFRKFAAQSVHRLRTRRIFSNDFIDSTLSRLGENTSVTNKMLCGLLSVDLALEANWFSS